MSKQYILAFDHGTTGIKACLFDSAGVLSARTYKAIEQIYPTTGWVEHKAEELWSLSIPMVEEVLTSASASWGDVDAIGITNQRETTVLWDKKTGKPVYNAIVWQCRRTNSICEKLKKEGLEAIIQQKTGLLLDPYFSGTKVKWILDNVPEAKSLQREGRLLFGTVDTWIIWNLSGGMAHVTDPTNASRTLLYNIREGGWDSELLEIFGVSQDMLPEVRPSSSMQVLTLPERTGGLSIPIMGDAGDQQAALYGQNCWKKGEAKSTYGTGTFLVMNLGENEAHSGKGLLTTVGCDKYGQASFAYEGSVFISGGTLEWLKKGLGIIESFEEAALFAAELGSNDGVYLVPAFVGLGAPYWDADARASISGLTHNVTRKHLARAAFEAMAYQTREVLDLMQDETGQVLKELCVDGGVTRSDFFMQFLADTLAIDVIRSQDVDITAKGVAYLAGLGSGFWGSPEEIATLENLTQVFSPKMGEELRAELYSGWMNAVKKVRTF
ncbi:MAG: glycerol kinase [Chlamydiales bacterium]|jgi:glycerol kinase